ncbi:MAG: rRNA maturation RNase YbeY [Candidatus Margulisiibacteriota bacterium]|jgi:diacylglycerol kinase (ATP)
MRNSIKIEINYLTDQKIKFDIKSYIEVVLSLLKIKKGYFEFSFVDNKIIKEVNSRFLNKNNPTDVITFNLDSSENIIGDIYISLEEAKLNAHNYHNSLEAEIKTLIVHAILHLLDYQDYSEEEHKEMHEEQNRILALATKKTIRLSLNKKSIFASFGYAFRGIWFVIYSQRNMKIHIIIALLAVLAGIYLGLSQVEWMILLMSILMVLITETINTSIEILVDLATKKRRYRAMLSKDIAAGAVLIASLNAIIIAYFLFIDKLIFLIKGG